MFFAFALEVIRNLLLQFCFFLEMPVSALDQAVEHREKRSAKSHHGTQKPHGKPDLSVSVGLGVGGGLHFYLKLSVYLLIRLG